MTAGHSPVMLTEALEGLRVRPGGRYLDATVGLGGHARAILEASAPDGRLLGLDRDEAALALAKERLAEFGGRASFRHANHAELARLNLPPDAWDGILADLGVSSLQLDTAERGFSFARAGPLDMRMDPTGGRTAADLLQRSGREELERMFRDAGEERFAKRLARLCEEQASAWRTTSDLAAAVARVVPRRGAAHPATRVFLALRMAVNGELTGLGEFLEAAPGLLVKGGRLAVITFHSAEDRVVKHHGRDRWKGVMSPVNKKPLAPSKEEESANPRSRSAKLRVYQKL